ncbi:MAG: oxygen-independent coproporphyrinogen-3 oxidase [Planctomycetota bacterium]|jgi:oxygen-independent coproporphyrinogen-3 oxidase
MRNLAGSDFPDRGLKYKLFSMARKGLLDAGYHPIGMDHFAKPYDELSKALAERQLRRNFQGSAVIPAKDAIALGISAIGGIRGAYIQNMKKLSDYCKSFEAGEMSTRNLAMCVDTYWRDKHQGHDEQTFSRAA